MGKLAKIEFDVNIGLYRVSSAYYPYEVLTYSESIKGAKEEISFYGHEVAQDIIEDGVALQSHVNFPMRKYPAPYGEGYYKIGFINGRYVAMIFVDSIDTNPEVLTSENYDDLLERLADFWF